MSPNLLVCTKQGFPGGIFNSDLFCPFKIPCNVKKCKKKKKILSGDIKEFYSCMIILEYCLFISTAVLNFIFS